MDPFEVRIKFTSQLQHLNASVNSSQKAASYALKHRDMDEDLHSCILEQLERNDMNNRANIMYFIEHLCDLSMRENHPDYVRMMQRDILRVIDAVAPSDGSGAANVKVVRRVLGGLQQKEILSPATVVELEECLKERDAVQGHSALSPTVEDDTPTRLGSPHVNKTNGIMRINKRQIEQRIEEDRERHKRQRENIWAIKPEVNEFDRLWDETSDIGEDDFVAAEEDALERQQSTIEV